MWLGLKHYSNVYRVEWNVQTVTSDIKTISEWVKKQVTRGSEAPAVTTAAQAKTDDGKQLNK